MDHAYPKGNVVELVQSNLYHVLSLKKKQLIDTVLAQVGGFASCQ